MNKQRVLIVSYLAYPLFAKDSGVIHGGSELAMYNVAKYTDKDQFEVHCIVGDFGQPDNQKIDQIDLHKGPKVKGSGMLRGVMNVISLFRLIKRINPSVIVSSSAGWLTVELILIKMILGKRYIFRSSHRRNIDGSLDSRGYGWLYRRLINRIDAFVIQNAEDEKILRRTYRYNGHVTCIRNFQDLPKKVSHDLLQRKYILWVGRSEAIKRPDLFLELAKKLPTQQFKMLMPKTNAVIYESIVKQAETITNLMLIPWVDNEAIATLYASAKYLVSTSTGEGLPNVILEAMKHGCPIISSTLDYDAMIKHGCGFVADGDLDAMVTFINDCQPEQWRTMSKACYDYAKDNFSATKNIKVYETIFRG